MNYLNCLKYSIVILFIFSLAPAFSQTSEDLSPLDLRAEEIVEDAHAFVLLYSDDMTVVQNALETDPRFIDREKELYIFMHAYNEAKKEAVCIGQGVRPELLGKNMWALRTPNGRMLFHEIIQLIESDGEGWIEYDWLNPFTNSLQTKNSFLKGITLEDGRNAWIGCGFWDE